MRIVGLVSLLILVSLIITEATKEITNLRTITKYKTRVDIAWDSFPNATLYEISSILIIVPPRLQTFYTSRSHITIWDLKPSSGYSFKLKVAEVNQTKTDETIQSRVLLHMRTNPVSYEDIINFRVTVNTTKELTLSWDAIDNVTEYQVAYKKINSSAMTSTTTKPSITFLGLSTNTTYSFTVYVLTVNGTRPNQAAQSQPLTVFVQSENRRSIGQRYHGYTLYVLALLCLVIFAM